MDMPSFAPPMLNRPGEIVITPMSYQSMGSQLIMTSGGSPTAGAWPAAGLVIYVPFSVPGPMTITKMFWGIGGASGNLDQGVWALDGTLLVSTGSTAASAAATTQVVDVTDTVIPRGQYYMGLVADTVTTLTILRLAPAAGIAQSFGFLEQASVTLPLSTNASPATFAKYTRAYVPIFGIQGYRTVGP